nr:MAG: replication associated protein [Cressdnaviricota sp.]
MAERYFGFTGFNTSWTRLTISESTFRSYLSPLFTQLQLRYFGQYELCDTTARIHVQCLLYSPRSIAVSSLRTRISTCLSDSRPPSSTGGFHLERAIDPLALVAYVSKTESRLSGPFSSVPPPPLVRSNTGSSDGGDSRGPSHAQQRNQDVLSSITSGASVPSIILQYPELWSKAQQLITLKQIMSVPTIRQRDVAVSYIYGEAGSGKSLYARSLTSDFFVVDCRDDGSFVLDGYAGQSHIIIDDITPKANLAQLLKLLDRYVDKFTVRYTSIFMTWTSVSITSNTQPALLYCSEPIERQRAFFRRVSRFLCFSNPDIRYEMVYQQSGSLFIVQGPASDVPPVSSLLTSTS